MKQIYKKILDKASSYYKKGRAMDVEHVKWMTKEALVVCKKENIDDSLLIPLVILHDVGYSKVSKNSKGKPYNLDIRKAHMKEGGKIAKEILEQVNYPKDRIDKIAYWVSVHDNWAFGDNEIYKKDKFLGVFTDLDYIWMATPKGFQALGKILNKDKKEMLDYLENNEKLKLRPFSTKTTKLLYEKYLNDRRKEVK